MAIARDEAPVVERAVESALGECSRVVLAVSGGMDSMTLLAAALTGRSAATLTCEGRPGATRTSGPDAVRAALVRDFGQDALESAAHDVHSRLGSTTHIAVLDADGNTASVTCSNGTCSPSSARTVPDTCSSSARTMSTSSRGTYDLTQRSPVSRR